MKNMKHIVMILVAVAVAGVIFVGARRYMNNEGMFAKKDNVKIQTYSDYSPREQRESNRNGVATQSMNGSGTNGDYSSKRRYMPEVATQSSNGGTSNGNGKSYSGNRKYVPQSQSQSQSNSGARYRGAYPSSN